MPTIPIYNDGQMPRVPDTVQAPVLQPEARLSYDDSGVMKAAQRAYQQPLLPEGAFQGQAIAGEAWGKTMASLGGMLTKLADERIKVRNTRDSLWAENEIRKASASYLATSEGETDSDKIAQGWDKWKQETERRLFDTAKLAPEVRDNARLMWMKATGETEILLTSNAVRREVAEAKSLGLELARTHSAQGRPEQSSRVLHEMVHAGAMAPEEAEEQLATIHAEREETVRQSQVAALTTEASQRPGLVLNYLAAPEADLTPEIFRTMGAAQRHQLGLVAQQSLLTQKQEALKFGRQFITEGGVKDPGEIARLPFVVGLGDERAQAEVTEALSGLSARPAGDMEAFLRRYVLAAGSPPGLPGPERDLAVAQLRFENEKFPEPMVMLLNTALDNTLSSGSSGRSTGHGLRQILALHDFNLLDMGAGGDAHQKRAGEPGEPAPAWMSPQGSLAPRRPGEATRPEEETASPGR
ncbi:MAG: hypothetical protein ACAI34_14200, partial [Verrucomicrobium sp.]